MCLQSVGINYFKYLVAIGTEVGNCKLKARLALLVDSTSERGGFEKTRTGTRTGTGQ